MSRSRLLAPITLFVSMASILTTTSATAQRILFDASHGETAGNADWIIDADTSEQEWLDFRCANPRRHHSAQRFPTPPQSEITLTTAENFWEGGISAWAVDLAKDALNPERDRDWQIEQYPWDAPPMTFGDPQNAQDLKNYDVLVLCEPNVLFTDAEAQAIREFVFNGGGLFLIADHETSDRNCSGGNSEVHDSPFILNRLMRTDVETSRTPPYFHPDDPDNDFGDFGIWFYENNNDDADDRDNQQFDWFREPVNNNVTPNTNDPIVHGPFGPGVGGLGLFGATQMAVSTHAEKGNPTARGHIWRNGQSQQQSPLGIWERVTFASASYGAGRVVAVGDSSPADDNTGQGNLHPGWNLATGGVANDILFLNASEWLANTKPDDIAPIITAGPVAAPEDCRATLTWVTDEPATSTVEWGNTEGLGESTTSDGFTTGHGVVLSNLDPETVYFYRSISSDRAGNGPTVSATTGFKTPSRCDLTFSVEPVILGVTTNSAIVSWDTNKVTRGHVRFTRAGEDEREAISTTAAASHLIELRNLEPGSAYRFVVESIDACGQGVASAPATFETAERPPQRDISGWRLVNNNANFEFTFPEGTEIAAGGFVVIGRDNDQPAFEEEWGVLAANVAYVNAHGKIVINSTRRPYRLLDRDGNLVDGPTLEIRSGRSLQRQDGCIDAGESSAWTDILADAGAPGRGTLTACGAGVVISEMSDGRDFKNEFVEVYFDP